MMDRGRKHVTVVTIAAAISRGSHGIRSDARSSVAHERESDELSPLGCCCLCFTIALLDGFDTQSISGYDALAYHRGQA